MFSFFKKPFREKCPKHNPDHVILKNGLNESGIQMWHCVYCLKQWANEQVVEISPGIAQL